MNNSKKKPIIFTLLLIGSVLPIQHIFAATTQYVQEGDADYKPGNPIYDRWDRFYQLDQSQPEQAEKILIELTELTPNDAKVWKSLTYLQIRLNKQNEALLSVRKASQLLPQEDQLKLQEAYLLNQLKRDNDALPIFKSLTQSSDIEIATKAQEAVKNLSGPQVKPIFKDKYSNLI